MKKVIVLLLGTAFILSVGCFTACKSKKLKVSEKGTESIQKKETIKRSVDSTIKTTGKSTSKKRK